MKKVAKESPTLNSIHGEPQHDERTPVSEPLASDPPHVSADHYLDQLGSRVLLCSHSMRHQMEDDIQNWIYTSTTASYSHLQRCQNIQRYLPKDYDVSVIQNARFGVSSKFSIYITIDSARVWNMPFVNEKISEQDIQKYDLREINKQFLKGDYEYDWTIDRERDIYLRLMGNNWQEPQEQKVSFYWKGHLLRFDLRISTSGNNVRGGKGDTTWSLSSNCTSKDLWLPEELEKCRDEITNDLKAALRAYKDFGRRSVIVDHTAYFQF